MLDTRIYRAAFVPLLLALLVVAFSLQDRPRPIGTTLAPDAFNAPRAMDELSDLAGRFPDRRPGSADDEGLARYVADELRELIAPAGDVAREDPVQLQTFRGRTIDGTRELTNVVATLPGGAGPGLVVVAHRDAAEPGSEAELSATAALLELARVAADGRLRRTITFVSTSGGTGGMAGARAAAERLGSGAGSVIVLGNVAGEAVRKPFVVGWSTRLGHARLRLQRTVEAALRDQIDQDTGGARAGTYLMRLAFPSARNEQGAFNAAGLPAVFVSVSGEEPPPADAAVSERRMDAFGRGILQSLYALDAGPAVRAGVEKDVVTRRKVLPFWAIQLLAGALLLPFVVATVDALARARRRGELAWPGAAAALATALALAIVAASAVLLRLTGLLPAAPATPVPGGRIEVEVAALVVLALIGVLAALVVRRGALQLAGYARTVPGPASAVGAMGILAVACVLVWWRNPYSALFLAVPVHLWLLATVPETSHGLRVRPIRLALALLGWAPLLLIVPLQAQVLDLSFGEALWAGVLAVAGGHIGPLAWLVWSVIAGCGLTAIVLAVRRVPEDELPDQVTVRGPIGYAGPGALGGPSSTGRRR